MVTLHTVLSDSWEGSTHSISERFQESKDYTCKLIEFVFVGFFQKIMQLHLFNTAEDLRQHANKYLKGQML